MTARNRKFFLTVHITSSLGWFGAVASFLVLAIVGMVSRNGLYVQAAYIAMQWITWMVIVPIAFLSLASGVACSQGTRWGLFRYYWVSTKLALTIGAIVVLLIHTRLIDLLSAAAEQTAVIGAALHSHQFHMVIASIAALVVLTVLTVLSVFKPRGETRYGMRKRFSRSNSSDLSTETYSRRG